jgi:threonine synthase
MRYVSTRGKVAPLSFQDAVMMGLADDGGLLIPEEIPNVVDKLAGWRNLSYADLAMEILQLFVTDIPPGDLRGLIERTYARENYGGEVAPTVRAGPVFVLELWHGPTLAFKDVALQLLGNLFEYILARRGGHLNVLGATSGDTGSAAIYGVRGRKGIHIFVMHPRGRVSAIQERQMTSVLDANVHNMAVDGSFDDCQRLMKELAGDLEFKRRHSIGAVNSVNWARVLAQIVYYFKTAFDVQEACAKSRQGVRENASEGAGDRQAIRVAVPTGNFGDVLAGWYAMKMGAPIRQLILATNENDILARFFQTGVYSRGPVYHTLSPSMDIQIASNFERYLYYKVGCDARRLAGLMNDFAATGALRVEKDKGGAVDPAFAAGAATQEEVLAVLRKYYEQHGYLLDPHTAVGVCVAEKIGDPSPLGEVPPSGGGEGCPLPALSLRERGEERAAPSPIVCLATAHPAKFPDAIRKATGKDIARHPAIDALMNLPTRCEVLPNDPQAVRRYIERTIG